MVLICAGMSSGPSVSWTHPAFSGASRLSAVVRSQHRRIGIFLDRQRGRGVADEQVTAPSRAPPRAGILRPRR